VTLGKKSIYVGIFYDFKSVLKKSHNVGDAQKMTQYRASIVTLFSEFLSAF
jgi:hypothetical protein